MNEVLEEGSRRGQRSVCVLEYIVIFISPTVLHTRQMDDRYDSLFVIYFLFLIVLPPSSSLCSSSLIEPLSTSFTSSEGFAAR